MRRLADRLSKLRTSTLTTNRAKEKAGKQTSSPDTPPPGTNWKQTAQFVWERRITRPAILPDSFNSGFILPSHIRTADLVFYDLETTGLSGGAGNIAFLIGLGNHSGTEYALTQLFLADYPGEPDMLERYRQLTADSIYHLSYNGLSFDSQVIKTRFLLNRLAPPSSAQIDLLYPARRLWRGRLPNLRLNTVETDVLGVTRDNDLPGSEAPQTWFNWLNGYPSRLDALFHHNAEDVYSLAKLLLKLEKWGQATPLDSKTWPPLTNPTHRGMARQWNGKNSERGIQWLKAGWANGDTDCGYELAYRMKRQKNYSDAALIWEKINSAPIRDYRASKELAMYWEHRRHNPQKALAAIEGLNHHEEIAHRRGRLRKKLGYKA